MPGSSKATGAAPGPGPVASSRTSQSASGSGSKPGPESGARAGFGDAVGGSGASIWLDAWLDPLADFHAFSNGLCVDGDQILAGDLNGVLKVFRGSKRVRSEDIRLPGVPSAVRTLYYDQESLTAMVAVACGPSVFVFKKLAPYFKFTVEPSPCGELERDAWEQLRGGAINASRLCQIFRSQPGLSERSLDLLALENEPSRLESYVKDELAGDKYKQPISTCITCMEVLTRHGENANGNEGGYVRGPGLLVLGTESRKVLILDPSSREIIRTIRLPSVPVFIAVSGSLQVEYRIIVSCRDNRMYSIKNGDLIRKTIDLESQICGGVVRCGKSVITASVDRTLHCYTIKGRKEWTLRLPYQATNMCSFVCERAAQSGVLVALRDGQVRLYMGNTLMSTIHSGPGQVVTGMRFGPFSREPNALILLYTSGALAVKILKRTAKLDPGMVLKPGPPKEQDVPIPVPKKTKLYVEQTQRERECAVDMHRSFQHSLCKLRYLTAKSYLRLFEHGGTANAQAYTSANQFIDSAADTKERVSMSCSLLGLGPKFKLLVSLENVGRLPIGGSAVALLYDTETYRVETPLKALPALVPGVLSSIEMELTHLQPGAESPPLQLSLVRDEQILITASVEMPVVESI